MSDRHTSSIPTSDRPASAPAPAEHSGSVPPKLAHELAELMEMDLERLIATYELEVTCHHCKAIHKRAIGALQADTTMECPQCHESIVLRTSLMNEEMRRIGRQLRKLHEQLAQMIERATGLLSH